MAGNAVAQVLLEREDLLGELERQLGHVLTGEGRLVLLAGEAGAGKSALVQRFCVDHVGRVRVLRGACDALVTPRPLGPFLDVAAAAGGALGATVGEDTRARDVLAPLLAELAKRPAVVVLEDFHWADEASLDLLRLLGRRLSTTRSLLLVTYRDDELDPAHPLRPALAGLASSARPLRLRLPPLSAEAVCELAEPHGLDGEELYRRTDGNPFFVTEILAAGGDEVPAGVRDAVLARAAKLGRAARRLLEAVAVVPTRTELWLLEAVAARELHRLEECLASGMLQGTRDGVAFRHELARLAVEEAVAPHRRRTLHAAIVAALAAPPSGTLDSARLAHHAEGAGDAAMVLAHAPAAGKRAAAHGAHREAAAQYARAIRFSAPLGSAEIAELLDRRAHHCYLTGQIEQALEARRDAAARYRALGDRLREGEQLSKVGRLLWHAGRREEAEQAARTAVTLLETQPPGRELATAYATMAARRSIGLDLEGALEWGERAIALAEGLHEHEIVVFAMLKMGTVEGLAGRGTERLRRSLELALEHDFEELVTLAYGDLNVVLSRQRRWTEAERVLADGLEFATARNLETDRSYLLAWRAWESIARCRWDEGAADLISVLRDPATSAPIRATALLELGLMRARRGDPGAWEALDESLAIAERAADLPKLAPLAVVRAEAALLEGHPGRAAEELARFDLDSLADRWIAGDLAIWARRAGAPVDRAGEIPEAHALELAGDHAAAAAAWRTLDSPYDAAMALAWSDDEDDLRRAHAELAALGARPAAGLVARRLRERGVRGVERGPRPATRENPAGLTARELDVLGLVAQGLRNAEIAERLFLSPKTVDHHVSAILRKLPARTRTEASAEAVRLGLAEAP